MTFEWTPGRPPPLVEEHSSAKLEVLRKYLSAYFDRLGVHMARDEFRLDLVDGFAGGGSFLDGDTTVSGSPLVMLEEASAAQERLNRNRTKPLHFDCKFHFVDVLRGHTDHLRLVLAERGYSVDDGEIAIHTSPFAEVADAIIGDIKRRQPRAGRAIFLLDQTGFSRVELALVARILNELQTAEVILTFATDVLVNLLSNRPSLVQAVAPLDLSEAAILDLIELKDGAGGKALAQRVLREHIRNYTGAAFDTPFFIRPKQSRRALWFLHLSRHPTARDVMIQCHWSSSNTFEHYGSGDFQMLGWDALHTGAIPLFSFEDIDAAQMKRQLLDSMPSELSALAAESPVSVETMRHMFANRTAARFSDLDEVVLELVKALEFDILNPVGRERSRSLTRLNPNDRIVIPRRPLLPGISFRQLSG